ncbi:MAG TPA: hypothetical protein VFO65_09455 [Acidimicrobiales bacterium]|nr:hypothetical protein [Acidimicrobiales bacterium]
MCISCVTTAEAVVVNGGGLVVGALAVLRRSRIPGPWGRSRPRQERAADRRRDTAAFLSSLGLDPDAVLGPEPDRAQAQAVS